MQVLGILGVLHEYSWLAFDVLYVYRYDGWIYPYIFLIPGGDKIYMKFEGEGKLRVTAHRHRIRSNAI